MSGTAGVSAASPSQPSTHGDYRAVRHALIERIGGRLRQKGFPDGFNIVSEFSRTVQVEIISVAEMHSELAGIVHMAEDVELQAEFSGFLAAPLVTGNQKKAAYLELRNASHFPPIDQPDIKRAWGRVIHAVKTQWGPEQSAKIEDFSYKLMLYFLEYQKRAEHRRDLEHMSEGIITEKLEVFFHDVEAPVLSGHSRDGV